MGWDQSTGREDVQAFLLKFLEEDPNELLRKVIEARLAEKGLTYEVVEDTDAEEGDGLYEGFHPRQVKFSNGQTFTERCTEEARGDDWGQDWYSFVEDGKPYEHLLADYNTMTNEPEITKTVIQQEVPADPSIDQIRRDGNELSEGMGDAIADFFTEQGITEVSFEPGGDD